jgi:aminopeptidase-like protein
MGRNSSIRAELLRHLNTDPDHWTPYRHTYYRESWGFCAAHSLLTQLAEAEYRVRIDFRIAPGSLSYGELYVRGAEPGKILVSTHVCHPLLGNDNLSGVVIGALLAQDFQQAPRRFLFVPATLRPIVWLSRNETVATAVRADLVLAGVGDDGAPTYMRSRRGDVRSLTGR